MRHNKNIFFLNLYFYLEDDSLQVVERADSGIPQGKTYQEDLIKSLT